MSQPPSQSPWSSEPAHSPAPGAPTETPAFAVRAEPLHYVHSEFRGRPGLVTAIGVLSIVVGSLGILYSITTVMQAGVFYMMSVMSTTVAAAQARAAAAPMPAPTSLPASVPGEASEDTSATGPRGMNTRERGAAVDDLTRLRALTPTRKRHLDAILASAGKDFATDVVTGSGTMPEMRSGEAPPEYFVTRAGRLEVFNDRAVFYPTNGPTIRASAPPQDPQGGPARVEAEPVSEVVSDDTSPANTGDPAGPATATGTASPNVIFLPPVAAGGGAATMPGALTPADIQAVLQQAQSLSGNGLNPAQAASLGGVLSSPGQQLVQAGAAQGSVVSAYAPAGAPAVIQFADGGSVTIAPAGNVVSMAFAPVMPTFNFNPVTLSLMVITAVASLGLAIFLLVCGIVMLRQSPRARRLHLIYSAIKIPLSITAGLVAAWVAQDMMSSVTVAGAAAPVGPSRFSLFSGIVPIVLGCAYPVALLFALNVKSVRDYYGVGGDRAAGQSPAV